MAFPLPDDNITEEYQNLLDEVEQIRNQDIGLEAVENISRVMDVAEKLVANVNKPREIGLDARVLELSSVVIQQNAEKIDSVFRPLEFADKLINFMTSKGFESSQSEAAIWNRFGEKFGYLLPLCPGFDYMLGTYSREGFKPKERAPRQSQDHKNVSKEMVKAFPEKIGNSNETKIGQQEILDYLSRLLVKLYKNNGNKPISYFNFILNPNSFEETCQNILNVAFLVRDSYVKMFTVNDDLLMVPIKPKRDDMGGLQREESKRQFVIQLDWNEWKALVDAFEVVEPTININHSSSKRPGNNT